MVAHKSGAIRGNGRSARAAVKQGERIQAGIDRKDRARRKQKGEEVAQAGSREYPDTFPPQHLQKPGLESNLKLAPMYQAPGYKGSGKLEGMAAIRRSRGAQVHHDIGRRRRSKFLQE